MLRPSMHGPGGLIQINVIRPGLRQHPGGVTRKEQGMTRIHLCLIGCLAASACAGQQPDPQPGREIYMGYCVSCHGPQGRGDGPLAGDLALAPANLTQLAAANGGVFPTTRVMAKIHGYPGRYQSDIMPEFGPVLEGPMVMWKDEEGTAVETPQALIDLTAYLVSIQLP